MPDTISRPPDRDTSREQLEAALPGTRRHRLDGIEDYLWIGGDQLPARQAAERLGVGGGDGLAGGGSGEGLGEGAGVPVGGGSGGDELGYGWAGDDDVGRGPGVGECGDGRDGEGLAVGGGGLPGPGGRALSAPWRRRRWCRTLGRRPAVVVYAGRAGIRAAAAGSGARPGGTTAGAVSAVTIPVTATAVAATLAAVAAAHPPRRSAVAAARWPAGSDARVGTRMSALMTVHTTTT